MLPDFVVITNLLPNTLQKRTTSITNVIPIEKIAPIASRINKIIYKDAEILENNFTEGCYWVYDEMYLCDKGYEFHIAVDGENGYNYITLQASDVIFE